MRRPCSNYLVTVAGVSATACITHWSKGMLPQQSAAAEKSLGPNVGRPSSSQSHHPSKGELAGVTHEALLLVPR